MKIFSILLLFFILFNRFLSFAQHQDSTAMAENDILSTKQSATDSMDRKTMTELEIGQLIINETISKIGSDFQQLFNTQWTWPTKTNDFIITLTEKPTFGNSTLIEISINEYKIFESFLQPRYDALEELATQAVEITHQYLLNYEELVKQVTGDELAGSGIY